MKKIIWLLLIIFACLSKLGNSYTKLDYDKEIMVIYECRA
jgi:hypothetical protein